MKEYHLIYLTIKTNTWKIIDWRSKLLFKFLSFVFPSFLSFKIVNELPQEFQIMGDQDVQH